MVDDLSNLTRFLTTVDKVVAHRRLQNAIPMPMPCRSWPMAAAATKLHRARLEVQPPTAPLQSARPARDRGPLPARHVEMESHRTPPVLRDQQELGGPPLDSYETILKYLRTTRTVTGLRMRAPSEENLQDRRQDHRSPNAGFFSLTQRPWYSELVDSRLVGRVGTVLNVVPRGALGADSRLQGGSGTWVATILMEQSCASCCLREVGSWARVQERGE